VDEIAKVALEPRPSGRLRLVANDLRKLIAIVGGEAVETAAPARFAVRPGPSPNDGRFHDELFPLPRCAQRPGDNRLGIGIDRQRVELDRRLLGFDIGRDRAEDLVLRTDRRGWRRAIKARDLAERQIFVEPAGRQTLDGRGQERDERTPRRIRAARSAIEVDRYLRAGACVLEEAQVLLRRPQEDRHLVEGHS